MRLASFWLMLLFGQVAHGGCSEIGSLRTETIYIDISDGGCKNQKVMIAFAFKKAHDTEFGTVKEVPFELECKLNNDGFKCRKDGKSPLAGATYKRIWFGRSGNACDEDGTLGQKYICVVGCSPLTVPEYLNGSDGSC